MPKIRRERLFHISALVSGLVFGLGLAVSGMTHPAKVKAFLDISAIPTGRWDPSLAFVLAAAVFVTMFAIRIAHRRRQPIAATAFSQADAKDIDGELIIGSVLFGVGWGMAGLCPGPAIADIVSAFPDIVLFLGPMLFGSFVVGRWRAVRGHTTSNAGREEKA